MTNVPVALGVQLALMLKAGDASVFVGVSVGVAVLLGDGVSVSVAVLLGVSVSVGVAVGVLVGTVGVLVGVLQG